MKHLLQPQLQEKKLKNTQTHLITQNNIFVNNEWVNNEIKEEIKRYLEANKNENTTTPNL